MTPDELLDSLRQEIARLGSQGAFAERYGVSPSFLCQVLSGKREPGRRFLKAVGLRRIVTYESIVPLPGQ